MSSNANVSPYFNGGWDGAASGLPPINKYTQGSPKQHHVNPRQHKSNHQLMSSCPLPSEYVIPHTLISFSLKKTHKNPTKPIKIPWRSFAVSWVFEMVLWCLFFLPKRHLTREYPKHPLVNTGLNGLSWPNVTDSDVRMLTPVAAFFHIGFRTLALASHAYFIHLQHSVPKSREYLVWKGMFG